MAGHKKAGADAPAESAALATAYCIVSMLRDCFILEVTLRCSLAERWVYLRGRILPVSVIKRLINWGLVKGISSGLRVWVLVSVVLMIEKGVGRLAVGPPLSTGIFGLPNPCGGHAWEYL